MAHKIQKSDKVVVCENNLYGISTQQDKGMAITDISDRATSYNMPGVTVDGNDVLAVNGAVEQAVKRAKAGEGPTAKDPIPRFERYLVDKNVATEEELNAISNEIQDEMIAAVDYAIE
ncbi:MAG: thiamine pyrophosphate-dependent enzyme [Clostridia bacterium]|nr:thiamine pyrophosphate-dependent enzyme [Clostridia bacterium]